MALKNMCLAVNGGVLEGSAGEGNRNGNFTDNVQVVQHQGGGAGYAYLYLRVAGVWTYITNYYGSGLPTWSWYQAGGTVYNNGGLGWKNVTGIRMIIGDSPYQVADITFPKSTISYCLWGTNGNGNNDVVRSYGCEIQAWGTSATANTMMFGANF